MRATPIRRFISRLAERLKVPLFGARLFIVIPITMIAVLALSAGALVPAIASAHVLKTDGAVGAVMHVDPDDDPIALQPANFYFYISEAGGTYDPSAYALTATVVEGSTTLDTEPLAASSTATFTYTFPARGVFEVTLIGTPASALASSSPTATPAAASQPFSLTYDVRVDRIAAATSTPSAASGWESFFITHLLHVALVVILIGVLLVAVIRGKPKSQATESTPTEPKGN